jgi:hypothetical protein
MTKYTLIAEHTDLYTGSTISKSTHEFEVDGLMDVVENMELFLKGAGFVFDGYLDIVPVEDNLQSDIDEFDRLMTEDTTNHSDFFFDTERNK